MIFYCSFFFGIIKIVQNLISIFQLFIVFIFLDSTAPAFRSNDNISCKTLFFSEKLQTFTNNEKMYATRKSIDTEFGKNLLWKCRYCWSIIIIIWLWIGVAFSFPDHHSIDPIANRENENRSHSYGMSPNRPAVGGHGNSVINMDLGRKQLDFSPDHVQCLCEALQQKGDVEKLATLLWSLPSSDFIRSNESILR